MLSWAGGLILFWGLGSYGGGVYIPEGTGGADSDVPPHDLLVAEVEVSDRITGFDSN
jgi:hypothetical protein